MKKRKMYNTEEQDTTVSDPKKKKLPGWMIIPILVVVVLIVFGLSKLGASGNKGAELAVTKVKKEDVKQIYNTSGIVQSGKIRVFYSPVNATVKSCNAKVGEAVKKGDKLITFDVTNLERDNRQSELNALSTKYTNQDAAEQSSRASKSAADMEKKTKNSIKSLETKISNKKNEIKKLEKTVKSSADTAAKESAKAAEIQKKMQINLNAQTEQKAVKENADRQLANLDRSAPDYEQKSKELVRAAEDATNTISSLEQEYRTLEQQMKSVGGTDAQGAAQQLVAAKQELETLKASLDEMKNSSTSSVATGLTGGQKKNMDVSKNLAELAKKTTKELLEEGKKGIKAEFNGVISDVKALEGSSAVQGGELFTLASNEDVYVELEVSVNDFDNLIEGNKAQIKIGNQTYKGTLVSINKIALPNEKGNPVIRARVDIDNPDENIYIGVNGKVSVNVAEKKGAMCLPIEVINTAADGDFVYVIEDGKVKKKIVELGIISDDRAEIVDGLKEGDEVIADTGSDITEGMKASAKKE